jgi:pimeloyl-ACP methyl ester carboxylesterase
MQTAKVRGVEIHYRVVGSTGPWAAMVTGGRRAHDEMLPLAEKLAALGHRVLLHDRRNTGASEIAIAGADTSITEEEIWADDLAELLAHIDAAPAFVGGSSSGSRTALMTALRHPDAVRGLLLLRVTGGDFAARRLPQNYYQHFIDLARDGGMAAVCATEQYQERINANPANRERLMALDPEVFIDVMSAWKARFEAGKDHAVTGTSEAELARLRVPAIVIPGNDKVHAAAGGLAAARMIPGAELYRLPIENTDIDMIPFGEWAPHYDEIVGVLAEFMARHARAAA